MPFAWRVVAGRGGGTCAEQTVIARSQEAMTANRKRPLIHASLSPDAIARLDEMATRCGETRSGMLERLIREAEMPRPKTAGKSA
jgi:ribbon-helix-helix CopG family protein